MVCPTVDAGRAVPVIFKESVSGHEVKVDSDPAIGAFQIRLPEGAYDVRCGERKGTYTIDLRTRNVLDFTLSKEAGPGGRVVIRAAVQGHRLDYSQVTRAGTDICDKEGQLE